MKKALLALIFGTALVLAACGGGDDTDNATDNSVANNQGATENTGDNDNNANNDTTTGDETASDATTAEGDVAHGEEVVHGACISCHGANLEGQGAFPALNNVGSRLSQEEILNVINNGRGGMPAGVVKGEDAEAAAAYLATLK
ncbi:MAG TPA: cytochrome c [Ureibacillus sp.]|nr:cytochrome c [Ureibacillus sp.]